MTMRKLACAAILAAALGAQAQPPSGTPGAPPPRVTPTVPVDPRHKAGPDPHPLAAPQTPAGAAAADPKASADAAHQAARKACDAKTGSAKEMCLKDANAAHDRALGRHDSTTTAKPAAPTTPSPAVPGTSAPGGTAPK